MSYAFISHRSACEALRACGADYPRWPDEPRLLPLYETVFRQREFAQLARDESIERLGIVTRPVDILTQNGTLRRKGKQARTHPWMGPLPQQGFLRITSHVLVSVPEFALLQLANVHVRKLASIDQTAADYASERDALASMGIDAPPVVNDHYAWERIAVLVDVAKLAMELSGSYRVAINGGETLYQCPQLTNVSRIADFAARIPEHDPHRHSTAFVSLASLLPWVMENSASPMETALALMLTLPREVGGYGLPKPELNARPSADIPRDASPDLLWRSKRLVVEYDSSEFHAGMGPHKVDADIRRANMLRAAGYTVLEVTPSLTLDERSCEVLAQQVARLLDVPFDQPDAMTRFRRRMLHKRLFKAEERI